MTNPLEDVNNCDQPSTSDINESITIKKAYGRRHIIVGLCFCLNAINYAQKVNLSVGIVAMVDNSHNSAFKQFNWDTFTRGIILSSLYWGSTIVPLPAGILTQNVGAKIPLFVSVLCGSILTVLIPVIVIGGWHYLCVARFFIGATHGTSDPCMQWILAKWLHPDERGFLASLTFAGIKLGTFLMLGFGGLIAGSPLGWPTIFYTSGGAGLIWCIVWWIYVTDTPAQCKTMSKVERIYLDTISDVSNEKGTTPWRAMLTSIPYWSTFLAHITCAWGFILLLTEIPTYLNGVYHFDINSNGVLSAIPYVFMFVLTFVCSFASKWLISRKFISKSTSRKLFNSIAMWGAGALLIILSYTWKYTAVSMVIMILMVGVNCAVNVGFLINYLDLSPNYVGYLMGIGLFAANIMAIVGPLFVGYIVTDVSDPSLWRIVFIFTAILSFVGNAVFVLFGKADVQKWNDQVMIKHKN